MAKNNISFNIRIEYLVFPLFIVLMLLSPVVCVGQDSKLVWLLPG